MKYSEKELVLALIDNSPQAYTYLYSNYSNSLQIIISRIVKDSEHVSDLLQDVFIKVFGKIKNYNAVKGSLYTWMAQIARNTAIDFYRKHSKNAFFTLDTEHHGNDAKTWVFQNHDVADIGEHIDKLMPERKVMIEMVYLEGFTYKEAAEEMEIPIGTAKSRARRALRSLKNVYDYRAKVA
ncbi:sigma-70 family RNA polymerase sigma factor [uncultured Arcticibacterium sp.]|uniref:RNA polymerase sigma factor n=1 Tax=uncultured Arcticibacterium sp. TaxID=2173042 RepID=UPI0030F6A3E1